jgi:hypothetical protein
MDRRLNLTQRDRKDRLVVLEKERIELHDAVSHDQQSTAAVATSIPANASASQTPSTTKHPRVALL